ncbi:uncharacterized protein LOC107613609 isoform X3 [Arachis ipaensis]|uniref:uncharacterized protein LOC107613609 isoform X3 n=1 Tax=Arachis ipaensis TaxID=130454 RepID=UPI0007AF5067|nr:uncharacterized protein LOC107613609 isoform X3 [Arachis ipaensis]XP_025671975.1 uncharacterized protein LOC112771436 isoform X3 [Arachis hypogaea]
MSVSAASLPLTSSAPPPRALSFPYFKSFHFPIRTPNHKFSKRLIANADFSSSAPTSSTVEEEQEEEESYQVLSAMKSDYNDIVIVDTPKSRMLLLDSTHNVHSILYKEQKWTGSYWDEFASLPAIVPKGPIAILGLGGGTAAHLMLHLWPSLQLEGWEIDEILIDKARDYFGLSDLEKTTEGGGILNVHIGDVFIPSENLCRRYAGIVVDLFSEGKVLPQLEEVIPLYGIIWACSCMFSATTVSCKERDETLAEPCFPCTMCYKFCDEQGLCFIIYLHMIWSWKNRYDLKFGS